MTDQVQNNGITAVEPAHESEFVVPAEVKEAATPKITEQEPVEVSEATSENDAPKTEAEIQEEKENSRVAREAFYARKAARKAEEAAARLAELERRMAEQGQTVNSAPKQDTQDAPKRPNPNDFELGRWDPKYEEAMDKYLEDDRAYVMRKATEAAQEAASSQARRAQEQVANAKLAATVDAVGKRGIDKYDDFEKVVQDALGAMPPAPEALRRLVQLENAEDVFYHLGQHPDVLEKITALEPMDQTLEFGKISARLASSAKVAAKVTKAQPTPTAPRGANGKFVSQEDARYAKMLKAQRTW